MVRRRATWLAACPEKRRGMDEAQFTTLVASSSVAAAALAFLLKLARDFVADKSRRAASLRIVTVYIRLAVREWEHEDMAAERGDERSIANLSSIVDNIGASRPADSALDPFTPFVAFSPHDDLSVAEVRDFLGFLDSATIESVVNFIQAEAMVHALASDFRSEFVRRQFTQERKVTLVRLFNAQVIQAYDAGHEALKTLGPYETCPRLLWCLPFGYRFWRAAVSLRKLVPNPRT